MSDCDTKPKAKKSLFLLQFSGNAEQNGNEPGVSYLANSGTWTKSGTVPLRFPIPESTFRFKQIKTNLLITLADAETVTVDLMKNGVAVSGWQIVYSGSGVTTGKQTLTSPPPVTLRGADDDDYDLRVTADGFTGEDANILISALIEAVAPTAH